MEIIASPTPEQQVSAKIPPKDVWAGFESFEKASAQGFNTAEERIRTYGQFMGRVADFFAQPELLDSPTPEQRDLVRKLFYSHQTTAQVPIEFFVDAGQRLQKEVLEKRYVRPAGKKWQDEIDFIRGLTRAEFQKAALELGTEVTDRKKLEELAKSEAPDNSDSAVALDIQTEGEMRHQIQERAINLLAKDPDLTQDITKRNSFVANLRRLLTDYKPAKVEEALASYKSYLEKPGQPSVIDDIGRRIFLNQHDRVKEIIEQTAQDASQPDFMWKLWVEKGNIPPQLLDSFDEVMTLSRLAATVKLTSGTEKSTRARRLLPFVNEGISATMISEIVNGKYEFPDDSIYRQIDAFIHFNDVYQEVKKASPLKRKVMIAALAAMVATALPDKSFFPQAPTPADEIQNLIRQLPSDELGSSGTGGLPDRGPTRGLGGGIVGKSRGQPGSEKEGLPSQSDNEIGGVKESRSWKSTPDNSSLEGFEKAMGIKMWELSGREPYGMYRTETAAKFERTGSFSEGYKYVWFTNRDSGGREGIGRRADVSFSKDIVFRDFIVIPSQIDSAVVGDGIGGQITLTFEGEKPIKAYVSSYSDGTLYIDPTERGGDFYKSHYGKKARITFSLEKTGKTQIEKPSKDELIEMGKQIMDIKKLPKDVQDFLFELGNRKDLSFESKAKILERYVKGTFVYSLNPKWSDYYHDAKDMDSFFQRLFDVKKTDCDVANTALIALLRSQGISARLVSGYAHESAAFSGDPYKIVAAEAHGWAEAFVNGKWITLDGTPVNQEDWVKTLLIQKLHPYDLITLPEQIENILILLESYKSLHREYPTEALSLDAILLSLGAGALSVLSRKRQGKLYAKLEATLKHRAETYGIRQAVGGGKVYRNEADKLRDLPFFNLPPVGEFKRARSLDEIKRAYSRGEAISSAEPNEFEFLTAVLGYKEADVRKEMYTRAYHETVEKLHDQASDLQDQALTDLDEMDGEGSSLFRNFREKQISSTYWALERPQNPAEWEQLRQKTKEQLFAQYSEFVDTKVANDKAKLKPGAEYTEPGRLTEKDFGDFLDALLRIRLARWIVEDSYNAAIASLPQN